MSDIVNLAAERDKRGGPDADHVFTDLDGVKWFEFVCSYQIDGQEFGFRIWATSFADAIGRIAAIGRTGVVDGQLFCEVPG